MRRDGPFLLEVSERPTPLTPPIHNPLTIDAGSQWQVTLTTFYRKAVQTCSLLALRLALQQTLHIGATESAIAACPDAVRVQRRRGAGQGQVRQGDQPLREGLDARRKRCETGRQDQVAI